MSETKYLSYPGMSEGHPVTVVGPVEDDPAYEGFYRVIVNEGDEPVKIHESRLHATPGGSF
jgi:hypothetical protein